MPAAILEQREQLTSLERIGLALQYQKPDRVPVAPLVCGASRRVLGVSYDRWSLNASLATQSLLAAQELIGFDGFLTLIDLSVEAADFGQEVIFPKDNTAAPNFDNPLIRTVEDYYKIKPVDPLKTHRMRMVIDTVGGLATAVGGRLAVMGFVYGPLGVLSQMTTHERLFKDIIHHPEAVLHAVRTINETLVQYARAQVRAGAHAIVIDPLYSSASILSKKQWSRFEGPFAREIANATREEGALVVMHNCGNGVYFDAIQEFLNPVGISHAYPAFGSANWSEHAANWAKKVVTIGYADPASVGHVFSTEQVIESCRQQIETFRVADGGFILSTGCEFPPHGDLRGAAAMVKAAKLYGKYE